jgi:hypothetical protein
MPRRIRAVSGKGRVRGNADIFVSGNGSGFGFGAGVGEKPAGKSAGEAARNCSAGRSGGRNWSAAEIAGRAGSCFIEIRLRLVSFRFGHGRRRCSSGLAAILCERLAGEKNGFFRDRAGCGGTGSFGRAMVKAALCGTTRFETARLAAAIFRTSLIAAAIIVTARFVTARIAALRRSVFGRREIATANARALRRASAAIASSTAAPAAATTAVTATITTAITAPVSTTIGATAVALAAATAGARSVVLRGIVVGRKILRSGGVRIGLALFRVVVRIVVDFGGVSIGNFAFGSLLFNDAGVLVVREGFLTEGFVMRIFMRLVMQRFVRFVRGFFAVSFVGVLVLVLMGGSGAA